MLVQKLQAEMIAALKNKEAVRLETLRYILAQVKNKEIAKQAELKDEEVVDVIKKIAKEMRESIEAFTKGNRADLAQQTKNQLEIVSAYLPAELSDEELEREIRAVIEKNKELSQKNPKAIIGVCMKGLKSKAESSRIIAILNKLNGSY